MSKVIFLTLLSTICLVACHNNKETPQIFYSVPVALETPDKVTVLWVSAADTLILFNNINKLKNLKKLNLSGVKLSQLPANISELTELEELNLASNFLSTLPETITKLEKLKDLNIRWNRLDTLSGNWQNLRSLEVLDLTQNKLSKLPEGLTDLKNLKTLNLKKNNFSPEEIQRIRALMPKTEIITE